MTPAAKVGLPPENNLFLTPEEFGRRGQFYFGLSAFEGFEFTDAFTEEPCPWGAVPGPEPRRTRNARQRLRSQD